MALPQRPDEILDPVTPQIVANDALSIRVGDAFQEGDRWVRCLKREMFPPPPGTRLLAAVELTYVNDPFGITTDGLELTAAGFVVRKNMSPGDRVFRIVRRVRTGDTVCSISDPNFQYGFKAGYQSPTATVVAVSADGLDVTICLDTNDDGVATISRKQIYTPTHGRRPE